MSDKPTCAVCGVTITDTEHREEPYRCAVHRPRVFRQTSCPECRGAGRIRMETQGGTKVLVKCGRCYGTGTIRVHLIQNDS